MTGLVVAVLVGAALVVALRPSGDARSRVLGARAERGVSPRRFLSVRRPPWRRRPPATDVVAAVSELSALVRAGLGAPSAWKHVTRGLGDDEVADRLRAAAARVGAGLSPVPALRDLGSERGGRGERAGQDRRRREVVRALAPLAATWAVHERTGAPVADLLDTLAQSMRDADEAALARRAALAAPVATARVLAGLPLLGLVLGQLVGARPLAVLVGTPAGRVSGVVGLVCVVLGVAWTRRLLRSADPKSSRSPR